MRHRLFTYLVILVMCLLTACTKNELTLAGHLTDAEGQTLRAVYRAADKKQSFLVDTPIPVDGTGNFSVKVSTRYPTVIWIFSSSDGELLMPVYAERGDELALEGKFSEPWGWTVTGNKVMEQYSEWAKENAKALKNKDYIRINEEVANYIKSNPESRTAAFLLFTHFSAAGHEGEYRKLISSLELDEDDMKEMEQACMPAVLSTTEAHASQISSFTLPALADTITTVNPSDAQATLIYCYRENPANQWHDLLSKALKDSTIQAIAIYMDTDTVRALQSIRSDSTLMKASNMWALGGEANSQMRRLGVTYTPYLIVTDKSGKVSYSGNDCNAAISALGL